MVGDSLYALWLCNSTLIHSTLICQLWHLLHKLCTNKRAAYTHSVYLRPAYLYTYTQKYTHYTDTIERRERIRIVVLVTKIFARSFNIHNKYPNGSLFL